jgi:hypothetical protein
MQQTIALHRALKNCLRERGLTYTDVAPVLAISVASVKRLFAQNGLSLPRIERLLDWLGLEFADLVELSHQTEERVTALTHEQEDAILADHSLLLVAYMLLNGWTQEEIVAVYDFTEAELFTRLAKLERMGFIEIMPFGRVKLRTARNFKWNPHGPIQAFFLNKVLREFVGAKFTAPGEKMRFVGGMLSRPSVLKMHQMIDEFADRFDDMVADDIRLPAAERYGVGMFVGLRPWEFSEFTALRRDRPRKKFQP